MTAASKTRRKRSSGPRIDGGSGQARKTAMLILEVLGGTRTPTDAARVLGVSTTRYYGLEKQGLEALVAACEPKSRGPRRSADKRIAALEKQVAPAGEGVPSAPVVAADVAAGARDPPGEEGEAEVGRSQAEAADGAGLEGGVAARLGRRIER